MGRMWRLSSPWKRIGLGVLPPLGAFLEAAFSRGTPKQARNAGFRCGVQRRSTHNWKTGCGEPSGGGVAAVWP